MTPCVATEFMDGESESVFYDVKVTEEVFHETELVCSVDILSNDSKLVYESHTDNDAKTKSCSEAHLRESVNYAANDYFCSVELEPPPEDHKTEILEKHCGRDMARKAPNEGHKRRKGVLNNSEMGPCADNHALDQLDDGKIELYSNSDEVKEVQNNPDLGTYHKDEVKEPTNDDLHYEVSNPNLSPKQVTSSLTFNSQPLDVLGGENGGCGEITSACSWNSFADGKFREEEHNKSCVVLEIPKHVRPTGIRKITFKFSKPKDECDSDLSVKPLADDKFNEDLYDNQISLSAGDGFHCFRNDDWIALENSKVKLGIVDGECLDPRSPSSCPPNMELRISKKIIPNNYPSNVKKLLSTGILEGARVKYLSMSGEVCGWCVL